MAVATSSGGVRVEPRQRALRTFAIIGALILAGYFALNLIYERVKPSPQRIYDVLAATEFDQPLPADLRATRGMTKERPGEGYVSIHLNTPKEPEGFDGPQARISYAVYDGAEQARAHFEEMKSAHRLQPGTQKVGEDKINAKVTTLSLAEQNFCYAANGLENFCDVLIGPVIIDISSNLEALGLGQDPYQELAEAALAHLRDAVPGVD